MHARAIIFHTAATFREIVLDVYFIRASAPDVGAVMIRFLNDIADYSHYPQDLLIARIPSISPRVDEVVLVNASRRLYIEINNVRMYYTLGGPRNSVIYARFFR